MKGITIGDLHFSPEREEKVFAILDEAQTRKPDFYVFNGDICHKALLNTESAGLHRLRSRFEKLAQTAPVYLMYGSPGHDAPGSLEIFLTKGVYILRPGQPVEVAGVVIYPVPEPSKRDVVEDSGIQAGIDLNNAVKQLYTAYGAHRNTHRLPSLVVGHGIVKTKGLEDEVFVQRASVYSTESELKLIGADAYIWADIHKPIDFATIPGGYTGSFSYDWNEVGYTSGWMEVETEGAGLKISRYILESIPVRKKFTYIPTADEVKDSLVWIELSDPASQVQARKMLDESNVLPGSRVTVKPEIKKTIRNAEISKMKTYRDMYLLWNPQATQEELEACDCLYNLAIDAGEVRLSSTISPLSVRVRNCKVFDEGMGKEEVYIDWTKYQEGILGILGAGGKGKSMVMDLSTPFIELFTQPNNFTSLFEGEGYWETRFDVNGDEILLKAIIKNNLRNPTAEYYASVNGQPVPECSKNQKPFLDFVYRVFGTPRAFASTVFRTQFENPATWNGSPLNPSIFHADNATLKTLVQEFVGTDKSGAVAISKGKLKEITDKTELVRREIEVKKSMLIDPALLEEEEAIIEEEKSSIDAILKGMEKDIEIATQRKEEVREQAESSNQAQEKINELRASIEEHEKKIHLLKSTAENVQSTRDELDRVRVEISTTEQSIKKAQENVEEISRLQGLSTEISQKNNEITKRNMEATGKYSRVEMERAQIISRNEVGQRDHESKKTALFTQIEALNHPCEHCGKLPSSAQERIDSILEQVEAMGEFIPAEVPEQTEKPTNEDLLTDPYQAQIAQLKTSAVDVVSLKSKVGSLKSKEDVLRKAIAEVDASAGEISTRIGIIELAVQSIKDLEKKIIPFISSVYQSAVQAVQTLTNAQSQELKRFQEILNREAVLIDRMEKAVKLQEEINKAEALAKGEESKKKVWELMVQAWGRDGIPAMILENAAPQIDQLANDLLAVYYPGLMIETSTLRKSADGKKMIEDFQINILNTETGRTKPINSLSGEQRDFVATAIYGAFRQMHEETTGIKYAWGLDDEPDKSVSDELLNNFWLMKERIDEGTGRLRVCVSHRQEAKIRFSQALQIEDI